MNIATEGGQYRMENTHRAGNCRWAQPTLFVPFPVWLTAEEFAWSCVREATPRPLLTTAPCERCPSWEPSEAGWPRNEEINVR